MNLPLVANSLKSHVGAIFHMRLYIWLFPTWPLILGYATCCWNRLHGVMLKYMGCVMPSIGEQLGQSLVGGCHIATLEPFLAKNTLYRVACSKDKNWEKCMFSKIASQISKLPMGEGVAMHLFCYIMQSAECCKTFGNYQSFNCRWDKFCRQMVRLVTEKQRSGENGCWDLITYVQMLH